MGSIGGRTGSASRSLAQDDQGVHRRYPSVRTDQERVDVRLGHLRKLHPDAGEADQGADELPAVRRRLAAERAEEFPRAQLVDHLPGMVLVEGGNPKDDVVEGLGEDAAEAEHDDRPELGVMEEAGDEFPAAGKHRLDQVSFEIRPCGRSDLRRRPAHLPRIL